MAIIEQLSAAEALGESRSGQVGDVRLETRNILDTALNTQTASADSLDPARAEFDEIRPGDVSGAPRLEETELHAHLFRPENLNVTRAVLQNKARQKVLREEFTRSLQAIGRLTPGERKNHDRIESENPEAARTFRLKNQLANLRRLAFGSEPTREAQAPCVSKWTAAQLIQLFFEFRERASSFSDPKETLAWDDMVLLYELSDEQKQKAFRENPYVREYLLFALLRSSHLDKNERVVTMADELIPTHASGMLYAAKGDALRSLHRDDDAKAAYEQGFELYHSHYPGLNLLLLQLTKKATIEQTDALCRSIGVSLILEGGTDSKEFWTHAGMLEVACLQNAETVLPPILEKMHDTVRDDFADWKVTMTRERLEKAKNHLDPADPRVDRLTEAIQGLTEICTAIANAKGLHEKPSVETHKQGNEQEEFDACTWNFRSLLHSAPVQVRYPGMGKEVPEYTMTLTDRKILNELLDIWQLDGMEESQKFIDSATAKISELLGTNVPGRRGIESKEQIQKLRARVAALSGVVPGKTIGTLTSASIPVLLEIGGAAAHAQLLQALFDLWQRRRVEEKLKEGGVNGIGTAEQILKEELRTAIVDVYRPVRPLDSILDALEGGEGFDDDTALKVNYLQNGQEHFVCIKGVRNRTDERITLLLSPNGTHILDLGNGDILRICTDEKQMRAFLVEQFFGAERMRTAGGSSDQEAGVHFPQTETLTLKQHDTHLIGRSDSASQVIFDFQDHPAEFLFRNDAGGELRIGGLHLSAPEQGLDAHLHARTERLRSAEERYPEEHTRKLASARDSLEAAMAELSTAIQSATEAAQQDAEKKVFAARDRYGEVANEVFSPNHDAPTLLSEKLLALRDITDERHLLGASVRGGLSLIGARNLLGADLQNVRGTAREIAANVRAIAGKPDTEAIAAINALRIEGGLKPLDTAKAAKILDTLRETLVGITQGRIGHTADETYLPMAIRDLDSVLPVIDMEVKLAFSRELHAHAMERENRQRLTNQHPLLRNFEEYLEWLLSKDNTIGKPPPSPVLDAKHGRDVVKLGSDEATVDRLRNMTQVFRERAEEGQANQPFTLSAVVEILDAEDPQPDDKTDRIAMLTTAQTLVSITGKDVELPAADRWKILEFSAHFLAAYRLSPSAESITLQDLTELLHDNAVKLAHQNAADFMTLVGSNHGVLHLLRSNGEMLLSIFRQLDHFTPERQALALQALFDHDMGYTKAGLQSGTVDRNLFQNSKDHPLESTLLIEAREEHYRRYFGVEGFRTIRNAVLDHSDALGRGQSIDGRLKPEILTDSTSSTEELVGSGLSLVDCLGTTGDVKLSSAFREFPQILGFMAQIQEIWDEFRDKNPQEKQLTGGPKAEVQRILDEAAMLVTTAQQQGDIAPGTALRIQRAIMYAMDLSESDFAIGLNFQMLGANVSTMLDFDQNVPEVTYFIDQAGQEAIMRNLLEKRTDMTQGQRVDALVRIGMKAIKKAADDFGGLSQETSLKVAEFIRNVNNFSDSDEAVSGPAEQYFDTSEIGEKKSFRRDGMQLQVRTEGGLSVAIGIATKAGNNVIAKIIEQTNAVTKARRKTVTLVKGMIENDAILVENGHMKSTSGLALSSKEAFAYIMSTLTQAGAEAFDVADTGRGQKSLLARLGELFGAESTFWPENETSRREALTTILDELESARLRPIRGIHGVAAE